MPLGAIGKNIAPTVKLIYAEGTRDIVYWIAVNGKKTFIRLLSLYPEVPLDQWTARA